MHWTEQGWQSVEVVVITAALVGLVLCGFLPFGVNEVSADERHDRGAVIVNVCVNFLFALFALAKGKPRIAVLGVLVPVLALVGAVRLARPGSPWARRFYRRRPRARRRARVRAERHDARWSGVRRRLQDWIGGFSETGS